MADQDEKTVNQGEEKSTNNQPFDAQKLGILDDVKIVLSIEIGRAQIKIKDLLNLTKDSVIDLNKNAGEPVDILANGKIIAKGMIVTVNGKYNVKLTSMPSV